GADGGGGVEREDGLSGLMAEAGAEGWIGYQFFHPVGGLIEVGFGPVLMRFVWAVVLAEFDKLVVDGDRVVGCHVVDAARPVRNDRRLRETHSLRRSESEPFSAVQ